MYKNGEAMAFCSDVVFLARPGQDKVAVIAEEGSLFSDVESEIKMTKEENIALFTDESRRMSHPAIVAACWVAGAMGWAISGVQFIGDMQSGNWLGGMIAVWMLGVGHLAAMANPLIMCPFAIYTIITVIGGSDGGGEPALALAKPVLTKPKSIGDGPFKTGPCLRGPFC